MVRGPDKGMELVIAGVVKGLADEAGFPLINLSLSYGCPSRHTLASGNKRLTAKVLVLVAKDIHSNNHRVPVARSHQTAVPQLPSVDAHTV